MDHSTANHSFIALSTEALKRALAECDGETIIIPLDDQRHGCLGDSQLNRAIKDEINQFDEEDCETQLHLRYGEIATATVNDTTSGKHINILTIK